MLYLGMSNYAAWQICRGRAIAERERGARPVVAQVVYNLIARSVERELLPFCRDQGVGVIVYNPLAAGLLTGKHRADAPPGAGTRFALNKEYYARDWRGANFAVVGRLVQIAGEAGISPVALALRWLAAQEAVDSIIIGASSMAQLEENLQAWEGALDTSDAGGVRPGLARPGGRHLPVQPLAIRAGLSASRLPGALPGGGRRPRGRRKG